jgi:methionyl-tRNA formyltransferase
MPFGGKLERVKLLRSRVADAHEGAPGTVLDENLTIACGEGAVRLLELQRAGSRAMVAEQFRAGARLEPGTVLP